MSKKYLNHVLSFLVVLSLMWGAFSKVSADTTPPPANGMGSGQQMDMANMKRITPADRKAAAARARRCRCAVSSGSTIITSAHTP